MNDRPAEIRPIKDEHSERVSLVIWFYDALKSCSYIQDPQLRSTAIREVVEAHRSVRRVAQGPEFSFGSQPEDRRV